MSVEGLLSVAYNVLTTENEYFNIYIDGVDDQVFNLQTEQLKDVAQTISSLLSKATTRSVGIRLLNNYLEQCSTEVFTRTGNLWTSLVLKSCQGQQDGTAAYEAFGKLALKSMQTPELTKGFATTHLSKVYESLTNVSASGLVPALSCLENCLRLYPSASGPSKRALEKFLARFHDSLDVNVVSHTGKCLHLLQQVSGGEAQSANHKTLWKNYQIQLVGSIHEVFDEMFVNCAEMWDDQVVQERLPSLEKLELPPEPINKAAQMYIRGHNLINYLITALKEPFPVEKPLLPRMILGVITRGLGVNCHVLHQNLISDNIALSLLLPKLHLNLLQLLDVAIVILRGHLLPYCNQILGLIMDVIKSTGEEEPYASNQRPFRQLRAKAYDTISLWCKVHNAGSRCDAIAEHLLQEIINDIFPKTTELTLQVTKAVSKHTSKKMKRQLQKAQNERSKIAQQTSGKGSRNLKASHNDERNQWLCISALKCLQAVLTSAANFIKPTKIKVVQTTLIQICGNLYELPMGAGSLYSSAQCRLEIYNALYVLMTTPHHLSPPPADIILALLNTASYRDGNMKVRSHCSWILQNLEKIIHPQKESLVFPIDARDIRNAFIMMGQEKLLAQDDNCLTGNDAEETDDEEATEETNSQQNGQDKEMRIENQKLFDANEDITSNSNTPAGQSQSILNKENRPDSPQTVSDSEDSIKCSSQPPVEISSGDESNHIKLQIDEDSEPDEVEIVSSEPPAKKLRGEKTTQESEEMTVGVELESEKEHENSTADNESKDNATEMANTSTDDLIMDLDEDALVEDIASQFVDDLA